jgi:hypothetical protein
MRTNPKYLFCRRQSKCLRWGLKGVEDGLRV